jgi:hypothetical protein
MVNNKTSINNSKPNSNINNFNYVKRDSNKSNGLSPAIETISPSLTPSGNVTTNKTDIANFNLKSDAHAHTHKRPLMEIPPKKNPTTTIHLNSESNNSNSQNVVNISNKNIKSVKQLNTVVKKIENTTESNTNYNSNTNTNGNTSTSNNNTNNNNVMLSPKISSEFLKNNNEIEKKLKITKNKKDDINMNMKILNSGSGSTNLAYTGRNLAEFSQRNFTGGNKKISTTNSNSNQNNNIHYSNNVDSQHITDTKLTKSNTQSNTNTNTNTHSATMSTISHSDTQPSYYRANTHGQPLIKKTSGIKIDTTISSTENLITNESGLNNNVNEVKKNTVDKLTKINFNYKNTFSDTINKDTISSNQHVITANYLKDFIHSESLGSLNLNLNNNQPNANSNSKSIGNYNSNSNKVSGGGYKIPISQVKLNPNKETPNFNSNTNNNSSIPLTKANSTESKPLSTKNSNGKKIIFNQSNSSNVNNNHQNEYVLKNNVAPNVGISGVSFNSTVSTGQNSAALKYVKLKDSNSQRTGEKVLRNFMNK